MKKLLPLLFLLNSFFVFADTGKDTLHRPWKLPKGVGRGDYDPNTVIVKFKNASRKSSTGISSLPGLTLRSAAVGGQRPLFSEAPARSLKVSGPTDRSPELDRIYEIRLSGTPDVEKVINELLENGAVEYAEPRYVYKVSYQPNDQLYTSQSYLAQVRAPQAWDFVRNSSGVVIAIVDSGSDLDHPDLAPNIFLNSNDPVNGIDDDGDGYTDNFRGWDFVGRSAGNPVEDNDPDVKSDSTEHGVHVSGIASAATDNGIGVSAIAFNARLMIVKAGADNDGNSIYRGYEGIKYAADHGAMIINCSWGGFGGGAYGQDIINYALSKGCLIVAAAGNENSDRPEYPAAYQGVISVGNVRSNDVKNSTSSFGPSLDLVAPGSAILSTVNNGSYAAYTGTSMAAPMVSGAAALVKTRFPDLNMQQVGEQLRVTADFIDDKNPGLEGQLGKGRLSVRRAVTEVLPSVRNQKLTVWDQGNGSIPAGDTVQLFLDLKNFLAPATGLVVSLSASNEEIQILTPQISIGTIGTLETRTMVGPFKVWVANGIDDNTNVDFRIDYSSNQSTYTDFEVFSLIVSADYINVLVNRVATTFTSNGRVGYSSPDASDGIGFSYKGEDLLFEASLMIGNSPSRVSNNARATGGTWDEHFVKQVRAHRQGEESGMFEGQSEFDDSGNPAALNLYVKHRMMSYPSAPDDKYVLVEYDIQNKNSYALSDVYVGLFTDWDIDDDGRDATRFDAANRMGYTYSKGVALPYAGVKILTPGNPVYYPLSYQVQGDPLQNGGFSLDEKFTTLSSGIKATGLGDDTPAGYDVMHVTGTGPHTIPANGSIRVAFALLGADNLEDLDNSARAAQAKYQSLNQAPPVSAKLELKQNYPNPVRSSTTIEFNIPQGGYVDLTLYNILGQQVKRLVNSTLEAGIYRISPELSDLQNGLYFYKIRFNNEERSLKLNLQH